jgi:hypothetical protein
MWLSATVIPTSTTKLSVWGDMTSNANNADQFTAQLQPTYLNAGLNGQPTVQFSTTVPGGIYMIGTDNFPTFSDYTIMGIFSMPNLADDVANAVNILSSCTGSGSTHALDVTNQEGNVGLSVFQDGQYYPSANTTLPFSNVPVFIAVSYVDSTKTITFNIAGYPAGVFTQSGFASISDNSMCIGAFSTADFSENDQDGFVGLMSELILFNVSLSYSNVTWMGTYLSNGYAIAFPGTA